MPLDVEAPRTPLARTLKSLESLAPARLRGPLAQARRDLAVVEGRLLVGEKPGPLVARAGTAAAPRAVSAAPSVALAPALAMAPAVATSAVVPTSAPPTSSPSVSPVATPLPSEAALVTLHGS